MEHKKALAALLSAVLVLLSCVSCGPSEQTKETLAEHDGHIYSEVADHLDRQEDIYLQLSQKTAELAEDPRAYMAEQGLPLTKIHGEGSPDAFPLEELAALEGLTLTSSGPRDFEVVGAGVDKGRALALIATLYGIPLEQCAAVGDSDNDLAALRAVGVPIAMGNASPAVQAAALRIAPYNRENGAAWAVLSCLG